MIMDDIFNLFENRLITLSNDLEELRKTFLELKEVKKEHDERIAYENPFMTFFRTKREIIKTNDELIKSYYESFIEELKTFINDNSGKESEEYLELKDFASKLFVNKDEMYKYFSEFANENTLEMFVNELRVLVGENGCKIEESPVKKENIKDSKEYKDFVSDLIKVAKVLSKKNYKIFGETVNLDEENENNSK